jgi:hypothetical protein
MIAVLELDPEKATNPATLNRGFVLDWEGRTLTSVSADIEKSIEDIVSLAKALETQVSVPDGFIMEANTKLAMLDLRLEAWVESGIGQTMFGYAQVTDDASPTKSTWELAFETENLGRSVESLLTAPPVIQVAALERLPYLLKAYGEQAKLGRESTSPPACFLSSPRERLGCQSGPLEGRAHDDRGDVGKRRSAGADVSWAGSGHQR